MRKSVLWNLSHVRLSFALLLALMGSLAIYGCGGGGGSSNPGGTTSSTTGHDRRSDQSDHHRHGDGHHDAAGPVVGATVSMSGTSLSTKTGADGKFTIINAPVGTVGVIVTTPDPNAYYGVVLYNSKLYGDPAKCPIGLTTQASSKGTSPVGTVQLYPGGTNPPPPPYVGALDANGCPK